MNATPRERKVLPAFAAAFALALLWAPATFARGGEYDDQGRYDSQRYDGRQEYDDEYGYDDGSCDYDHCHHGVAIPRFDELNGYGEWRWMPEFHTHLWFPWVSATWRPYYYGHWIRTSFGATWVSYEPWGDVPFHYGSWVYADPWGWGWVPGWQYSPAWVTWSVVDGYVGWAPCPPVGYHYPHGCSYRPSVYVRDYGYPQACGYPDSGLDFSLWIFVSNRDFCDRQVYRYALPEQNCLSMFKSKRVLPVGPRLDVNYVERFSPGKFRPVFMDRRTKQVGGRSIELYEPRGQREFVMNGRLASQGSWGKGPRWGDERRDAWQRIPEREMNGREMNGRGGNGREVNGREVRDERGRADWQRQDGREVRGSSSETPERVKERRDDSRDDSRGSERVKNEEQRPGREDRAERPEARSKERSSPDRSTDHSSKSKSERSDQDTKKRRG